MISDIVVTTVDIFTQLATRFFFLGFLMFVAYKIVSIFRSCNLGNVVKKKRVNCKLYYVIFEGPRIVHAVTTSYESCVLSSGIEDILIV